MRNTIVVFMLVLCVFVGGCWGQQPLAMPTSMDDLSVKEEGNVVRIIIPTNLSTGSDENQRYAMKAIKIWEESNPDRQIVDIEFNPAGSALIYAVFIYSRQIE